MSTIVRKCHLCGKKLSLAEATLTQLAIDLFIGKDISIESHCITSGIDDTILRKEDQELIDRLGKVTGETDIDYWFGSVHICCQCALTAAVNEEYADNTYMEKPITEDELAKLISFVD